MKIALASDHGGVDLKNHLIDFLKNQNIEALDLSPVNTPTDDYPDFAETLVKHILAKEADLGILICGTGIGISIAANRHKGIRAALLYSEQVAALAREHNDANILCFGERIVGEYLAKDICKIWLETDFEAERHLRRVNLIES